MWLPCLLACAGAPPPPAEPPPAPAAPTEPWRQACVRAHGADENEVLRLRAAIRRQPVDDGAPPAGMPIDGPAAEARRFLQVDGGHLLARDQGADGGGVWFLPFGGRPVEVSAHQVGRFFRQGSAVWAVEGRAEAFHLEGHLVRFDRTGDRWTATDVVDLGTPPLGAMFSDDGRTVWVDGVGGVLIAAGTDGTREVLAGEACVLAFDPCAVGDEACTPLDPIGLAALQVVRDRAATARDARAGNAVFVSSGDARPSERERPARVRYAAEDGAIRDGILVQAEWLGPFELLGVEHADGTVAVLAPDALR